VTHVGGLSQGLVSSHLLPLDCGYVQSAARERFASTRGPIRGSSDLIMRRGSRGLPQRGAALATRAHHPPTPSPQPSSTF